eukprot:tig00001126_g7122.t1
MENSFIPQAIELVKEAVQLDQAKQYEEALGKYTHAISYFMTGLKYEKNERSKESIRSKVKEYMSRAEQIKEMLATGRIPVADANGQASKPHGEKKGGAGGGGSSGGDENEEERSKFKNALNGAIIKEKPNVRWSDIAGLETAKEALKEAVILPIKFPQLFTGQRKPWKGILLYGPPGTGKSYLAKAVATESDCTFISVSSSDLTSKWLGDSEKLVRALFETARENRPSIVFIDEIDSLCSARSDSESEAARRIKTEFLVQMQGVGNNLDGVLVLAATNIPWNLDSAIRRRFEKRIYIPLPEAAAREQMFRLHLGDTPYATAGPQAVDFRTLGARSEGMSGSDVGIVVRDAIMEPVRTCQAATHFKQVVEQGQAMWEPCSPGEPGAVEKSLSDVDPRALKPPVVTMTHFLRALMNVKPSVGTKDLEAQEKFTREFGSECR